MEDVERRERCVGQEGEKEDDGDGDGVDGKEGDRPVITLHTLRVIWPGWLRHPRSGGGARGGSRSGPTAM